MTISRINNNLQSSEKIRQLNEMILELNGMIQQAKFDKHEISAIYADGITDRKYLRDVELGHTLGTYSGWTHYRAEVGYSIWKFSPTNYAYDENNQLYLDNMIIENKGSASAESSQAFDYVLLYDSDLSGDGGYLNHTPEASSEQGTSFATLEESGDYLYLGMSSAKFSGIKFEWQTRGSNLNLVIEYYNGASGDGWQPLSANLNDLEDDTSNFESDGAITWNAPGDWETYAVANTTCYWIRISTSTTPVSVADAYLIIPNNSVVGLLALSSNEIIDETWKWCTYGSSIYVTLRNAGASAHEGDYYITSVSTEAYKQNFFCFNHVLKLDHKDSTYTL